MKNSVYLHLCGNEESRIQCSEGHLHSVTTWIDWIEFANVLEERFLLTFSVMSQENNPNSNNLHQCFSEFCFMNKLTQSKLGWELCNKSEYHLYIIILCKLCIIKWYCLALSLWHWQPHSNYITQLCTLAVNVHWQKHFRFTPLFLP